MRSMVLAAWVIVLGPVLSAGPEVKIYVQESGSPAIDALFMALVSMRPAPYPTGGELPLGVELGGGDLLNRSGRCATAEVEAAFQKLKAISPKEYPHLLKHRDDDRYSYSVIGPHGSPASSGWTNCTVGDAVDAILTSEMTWVGGYKWRDTAGEKGMRPPDFVEYIESQGGMDKWVESVAALPRAEIDRGFLDWCIEKEEQAGFKDAAQRELILGRYREKKRKLKQPAPPAGEPAGK